MSYYKQIPNNNKRPPLSTIHVNDFFVLFYQIQKCKITDGSFLVAGGIESHVDTRNSEEHLMNNVFIHNMKETKRGRISQDIIELFWL